MNTPDIRSTETPALMRRLGLSRRQLMAASTGVAAASMIGPLSSPAAAAGNGVLIPRGKLGIILYSVRDAISRDPNVFNVPSGFKEVFAELAKIGYKQIEFAGYNQNVNAEGGRTPAPALLRAVARRQRPRGRGQPRQHPVARADAGRPRHALANFDVACEAANILGMAHVGTGSDPTSVAWLSDPNPALDDWQKAAARWNILGERAMNKHGLKLYTHNHDIAYSHLLDSGPVDALGRPTRSSGVRRLEWFMNNTDSRYVFLEMDIFWAHVAQFKHHSYTAADGIVVRGHLRPAGHRQLVRSDALPAVPRQGRRLAAGRSQGLRDRALRCRRHRLREVPGRGRRQGLPQPDVGAGQAPARTSRAPRPPSTRRSRWSTPSTASTTWRSCAADLSIPLSSAAPRSDRGAAPASVSRLLERTTSVCTLSSRRRPCR